MNVNILFLITQLKTHASSIVYLSLLCSFALGKGWISLTLVIVLIAMYSFLSGLG